MDEKLKMHTPNKSDENFKKLAELFPNAVTETITGYDENGKAIVERAIDKDVLMQEISTTVVEGREERYQFTWPDKKKSILLANAPTSKTLRPCREESVDFNNTENIFIEGDNLDALKLLQETYIGEIKMIYIDPPYNTGNDFIYKDNFSINSNEYLKNSGQFDDNDRQIVQLTESNGRFHTDWINMLYPRLKLSRQLLKQDGIIFISIDDNEYVNLKKVCDEIFGADKFIASLVVEMTKTQGMKVKAAKNGQIVKNHEYILIYGNQYDKNGEFIKRVPLYRQAEQYDTHYDIYIDNDKKRKNIIEKISENKFIISLFKKYDLELSKKNISKLMDLSPEFKKYIIDISHNLYRKNNAQSDEIQSLEIPFDEPIKYKKYLLIKNSNGTITQLQPFSDTLHSSDDYNSEYTRCTIRGTWWNGFYSDMLNVEKEGDIPYKNGKKPIRLIQQLAKWANIQSDDIILDFFAGSGTTAHAIMKYNEENKTTAKTILVQYPEDLDKSLKNATGDNKKSVLESIKILDKYNRKHFITELAKERIIQSGKEISDANVDKGFRVLKVDSSNMKEVYYTPAEYQLSTFDNVVDNIKDDRTAQDLLFQVMLDLGILLSSKIEEAAIAGKKIFNVGGNYLIACFDEEITGEVITEIAKQKPRYFVTRDHSMANDNVATNFEQIFATYSPETERRVL